MSSKSSEEIQFAPYRAYRDLVTQLDEFSSLTEYAYGLAQQLLFKGGPEKVDVEGPTRSEEELSYGMGDQNVKSVEMVCEWVPLEVYAEREELSADDVTIRASQGRLGPVRQNAEGKSVVLWPPKYHQMGESEWPELGKKKFVVTVSITAKASADLNPADLAKFEEIQQEFLRLAHALGEPGKVGERAKELLNRSVFVLEWIAFEVFLRSTIQELVRRHPHMLAAGKRGKENITMNDLIQLSAGLTDMATLRDNLAIKAIESQEYAGESVHGLLNFLKSQFKFRTDPYSAWYVLRGNRKTTSYNELLELKATRNALVHDGGRVSAAFQAAYPAVPIRDGLVVINNEFYLRASLALRSIAYLVSKTIDANEYTA
jgi:hypothetical protein